MRNLFGELLPPEPRDIAITAEFDPAGRARLSLRYIWDDDLPAAAFLMNNPSVAGSDESPFDPTARRTIHFAHTHGCGSVWLVNWCPLVATQPADMWKMVAAGDCTAGLQLINAGAVERAGKAASVRVVACGPEGFRRQPSMLRAALTAFLGDAPGADAMCLGISPEGAPLHPLARGKFAIPNTTRLRKWVPNWGDGKPFGALEQHENIQILSELPSEDMSD